MTQKVVLITGCSSGIGLSLAARIAKDEKKRFMGKFCVFLRVVLNVAMAFIQVVHGLSSGRDQLLSAG